MSRANSINALGPLRAELDAALLRGESAVSLSKRFGVSNHAIGRYKQSGIAQRRAETISKSGAKQQAAAIKKVAKKAKTTAGKKKPATQTPLDPMKELQDLYTIGQDLLKDAQNDLQFGASVAALGRLTRILEIVSKLIGDMPTGNTVINQITINEVSNQVSNIALNFENAPAEVRTWAAQNMLQGPK